MKAWLQRFPVVLSALWLSAVPWLLFPTAAPLLTAVSLLLLLGLLLHQKWQIGSLLPQTPINSYLLVFLLLTGVAYLVSPLPEVSLPKLTVTLLGAITFFLLLPALNSPDSVGRLVSTLALAAGPVALGGFFTLEWPERQVINLQPITDRLPHLSGSFTVNYNEMAGTLLIFFPFVVAALWQSDGRFKKVVFSVHLLLLLALMLFTQSRGAIIGLVVVSLVWWLWGRIPIRRVLSILLILALLVLLFFLALELTQNHLITWLSALDAGSKQGDVAPTSWLSRLEIWRIAGRMVADYPVIGSGLYTFDPVSRANYHYELILPSFNLTHAHNLLLQTATSLGIGGLLALLGIWAATVGRLWQSGRSGNKDIGRLAAVFGTAVSGYLFFNLYDTITFGQKPGLLVWIVLAGSVSLPTLAGEQMAAVQPPLAKRQTITAGKLVSFAPLLVLLVLLLSPALPRNLANLRLDQVRLQGERPSFPTAPGDASALSVTNYTKDVRRAGLVHYLAGDETAALSYWQRDPQGAVFLRAQGTIALLSNRLSQAFDWYNLSLELAPDSPETYLWRGTANETRGTMNLAEADFRQAAESINSADLTDFMKGYIFYRLGNILAVNKKWPDAAAAFTWAIAYQPDSGYYYQRLGDALKESGDLDAAEAAYRKADQ